MIYLRNVLYKAPYYIFPVVFVNEREKAENVRYIASVCCSRLLSAVPLIGT
jgi:hypothetical protein